MEIVKYEREPSDIKDFTCLPFYQILNNCPNRGYEWELIPSEISSDQLRQEVANCYMVSALESISHKPFLLNYIFQEDLNKFSSSQSKFTLTLRNENNKNPEHHIVLNKFPVKNNVLLFMKPKTNEAYAIIFEKVWAVIRGGYKKLEYGRCEEVFNKVLGTSSTTIMNKNMKQFDLDPKKYKEYKGSSSSRSLEDINKQIKNVQESDAKWINNFQNYSYNESKSNKVFESIKEAEKTEGAIMTVSINMGNGGHAYSILGTCSKKNNKTGKVQDFVILKNPWRAGDDIMEKINMPKIEEQINGLDEIKEINKNHYNTGVFYMPREYFEGWFRDLTICKPDYQKFFPKVYESLNLHRAISEFYNIDPNNIFFESNQGSEVVKTDIKSKENLDCLKKIIQISNSQFAFVYDKQELKDIWSTKNIDSKSSNYYSFFQDKNSSTLQLKTINEISENDFNQGKIYSFSISNWYRNNSKYSIFILKQINSFKEIKLKNIRDYSYNYYNNNLMDQMKFDLKRMEKYDKIIKEYIKEKFLFLYSGTSQTFQTGWSNLSPGIILEGNEQSKGHTHCHFLGKSQSNLFDFIGKVLPCSSKYYENDVYKYTCNEYFLFTKTVVFYDITYEIDGIKKSCVKPQYDVYNLEKEKFRFTSYIKSQKIDNFDYFKNTEINIYINIINILLYYENICFKYIPIKNNCNDIFEKIKDGIILCRLINKIKKGIIDESSINKNENMTIMQKMHNLDLAISASKNIGLKSDDITSEILINTSYKLTIINYIGEICKSLILYNIDLKYKTELRPLLNKNEKISSLIKLSQEDIFKWFNYQLEEAKCEYFKEENMLESIKKKNSEELNKLKESINDLEKKKNEREKQHKNQIRQLKKDSKENIEKLKSLFEKEKGDLIKEYEKKLKEQEKKNSYDSLNLNY